MSDHLEELRRDLARRLAVHLAVVCVKPNLVPTLDLVEVVKRATEDWIVDRKDYPHRDDHPLAEVTYGHRLIATLPFVPETTAEEAERCARREAHHWAALAWMLDFDPAVAAAGGYTDTEDDPGPPPERIGANQLLQQGLWWRARIAKNSKTTEAIRLEDMKHSHRLALLAFLRHNAKSYKDRADWAMAATPGPNGDMARDAFEDACDQMWETDAAEWIERQPLVRALAYWTTPYAEAPLTWHPATEHPDDNVEVMARWANTPDEPLVKVYWSSYLYAWCAAGGTGELADDLAEWRHFYPDEEPAIELPREENEQCSLCSRLLGVPGDVESIDCGGDCWGCIRAIEGHAPDCTPPCDGRKCQEDGR